MEFGERREELELEEVVEESELRARVVEPV